MYVGFGFRSSPSCTKNGGTAGYVMRMYRWVVIDDDNEEEEQEQEEEEECWCS